MFWQKTYIRQHERGLLFERGDYRRLLKPGLHRRFKLPLRRSVAEVQIVSTLELKFEHPLLDVLVRQPDLRAELRLVELQDHERALVWKDGRLALVLGPGRHALWHTPYKLEVDVFDTQTPRLTHPRLEAVLGHPGGIKYFDVVRVEPHEQGLLVREGRLVEVLGPGLHVFWKQASRLTCQKVDLREQVADVAGQEIMTSDKVTLRMNLVVVYQVVDAVKAVTVVSDCAQALYREAQLALRAAISGRVLDALLADKEAVGAEVRTALTGRAAAFGVQVCSVGLRDIILPGDMKEILNQVLAAEKQAQANLIKRREETAAARSQANTAKLLAENPQLARLKELELLQEILAGAKARFVFGRGDIVAQLRTLVQADGAKSAEAK